MGVGLLVAAIQGTIVAGGALAVFGIEAAALWGVAMAICAPIPLLGTAPCGFRRRSGCSFPAQAGKGVILIPSASSSLASSIHVRPPLLSGRTSASGLVIFLGLPSGGVTAFGFIGLVLGPIILADRQQPADRLHPRRD